MLKFDNDDFVPHFIYCYNYDMYMHNLKKMLLSRMKKYGIQSSTLTTLRILRINLMTKEKSKQAYEGKLKNEFDWNVYDGSMIDDLESFVDNLQKISSLEKIEEEYVVSFFLPKLTKEELKLVEHKNSGHMLTYWDRFDADVDEEEMKKSDSKNKYVHGRCYRETKVLNLDDIFSETLLQTSSEILPPQAQPNPNFQLKLPLKTKKCCCCRVS